MTILKTFFIGKTKVEQIYLGAQNIVYRINDRNILSSNTFHTYKSKFS